MIWKIILILCFMYEITNPLASDECTEMDEFFIYTVFNNTRGYVYPKLKEDDFFKQLITTVNFKKHWTVYHCHGRFYLIKSADHPNMTWNVKDGCDGYEIGIYEEPDELSDNIIFHYDENTGYINVCGRCVFRSKRGRILSAKNCKNKNREFFFLYVGFGGEHHLHHQEHEHKHSGEDKEYQNDEYYQDKDL